MNTPTDYLNQASDKFKKGFERLQKSEWELALLSVHGALEDYLRGYLASHPSVPPANREAVLDPGQHKWPQILDLLENYGGFPCESLQRIRQVNRQRIEVAHGGDFEISSKSATDYADFVYALMERGNAILGQVNKVATVSVENWSCPRCGTGNEPPAKFCSQCRFDIVEYRQEQQRRAEEEQKKAELEADAGQELELCPRCGSFKNRVDAKFCGKCGADIREVKRDKWLAELRRRKMANVPLQLLYSFLGSWAALAIMFIILWITAEDRSRTITSLPVLIIPLCTFAFVAAVAAFGAYIGVKIFFWKVPIDDSSILLSSSIGSFVGLVLGIVVALTVKTAAADLLFLLFQTAGSAIGAKKGLSD